MRDLIDRQAAIDAIRASTSKYTGFMEMEMYTDDDAVEAIEGLPAAQPKSYREGYQAGYKDAQSETAERTAETAQNVSDEDLISRKAAIDSVLDRMNVEKYGRDAKPEEIQWALEKLPSAQPERKRGQWIPNIYPDVGDGYRCSQCGAYHVVPYKFCHNCGADMREVDDE